MSKTAEPRKTPTAVLVASSLALAATIIAGVWLCSEESPGSRGSEPSALPEKTRDPVSAPPTAPSLLSPSAERLRPDHTLVLAQSRALEWHQDAALVAFEAAGVKNGVVDATHGGRISARFGKPSAPRVGAGAPVLAKQLVISIANGAASVDEQQGAPTVGIAAPQCTCDSAIRMAIASGVPASTTFELRYAFEPLRGAPMWRVSVAGMPQYDRKMDADTCAIILRL